MVIQSCLFAFRKKSFKYIEKDLYLIKINKKLPKATILYYRKKEFCDTKPLFEKSLIISNITRNVGSDGTTMACRFRGLSLNAARAN